VWQKVRPPPNLSCRYYTHSYENIIWAAKSDKSKYYFNYDEMKKINNNKQMKDIWTIDTPNKKEKEFGKHPTQKPEKLLELIIKASTKDGDLILDPFCGSGTTGVIASKLNRKFFGIDKEKNYLDLAINRIKNI
jgi:site-specific DNA-methyltransferase (adenine-specific)